MKIFKQIKTLGIALVAVLVFTVVSSIDVFAEEKGTAGITVSPMYQIKVLAPGEVEPGSFVVANPADSDGPIEYELEVRAFSYDSEKGEVFAEKEDYSDMVDWIVLNETSGTLRPNERHEVSFTINTPTDTRAGGQYAAIITKIKGGQVGPLNEVFEIAHLIYAEVSGDTIHKGSVDYVEVPSFLFSGNITGKSAITNKRNVHAYASHVLKVFPLFGDEEFFTNEEDPQKNLIMPDAKRYTSTTWEQTPKIGIFRVIYTVEFEGVTNEVSKVVIVCPLWLVILIAIILGILIVRPFFSKKNKKDKRDRSHR